MMVINHFLSEIIVPHSSGFTTVSTLLVPGVVTVVLSTTEPLLILRLSSNGFTLFLWDECDEVYKVSSKSTGLIASWYSFSILSCSRFLFTLLISSKMSTAKAAKPTTPPTTPPTIAPTGFLLDDLLSSVPLLSDSVEAVELAVLCVTLLVTYNVEPATVWI